MELKGYVTHIVYRNDETGYTVFYLEGADGDETTCVGSFPFISEGEFVTLTGRMISHNVYGEQFEVQKFEVSEPDNEVAILRYLSSGAVKGIRGGLAKRIVDKFGDRTFEVMEKYPEELAAVKGISEKKARDIAENFSEQREVRRAIIFLQKYGIPNTTAIRIYKYYREETFDVVEKTPYRMAEEVSGIGFKTADEIAMRGGFQKDSPGRIRAGMLYLLAQSGGEGNTFLPIQELIELAVSMLEVPHEQILDVLGVMAADRAVIVCAEGEDKHIYLPTLYYAELNSARMLLDLNIDFKINEKECIKTCKKVEEREEIELDETQRSAVIEALRRGVTVITGGPGTGKTTTINTLIRVMRSMNLSILMAAPTGRAAKRMEETCGYPAQTIHRLLEFSGAPTEGDDFERTGASFGRDQDNPLEADVVIVDEMSMVDIYLFHNLLKAIPVSTRLVLVGDVDQLPSVGPGSVLQDIIESEAFGVVKLTKIFRQALKSDIVRNAHRILAGESLDLENKPDGDFFFAPSEDARQVLGLMLKSIVNSSLADYASCKPFDIQVLAPMKKGETGVIRCNEILQQHMNPPAYGKNELKAHEVIFREGDKVMQTKNNYRMEYRILGYNGVVIEEGTGVFNGDIGRIEKIDTDLREVTVCFDEERLVTYASSDLSDLELAYAVTIHKSQGSEYPAVILPLLGAPSPLMTRNILYTAVTRGRSLVMIIGSQAVLDRMIANKNKGTRYSTLRQRIREMENT
ncbi:MAG: ATP-dependent RecD-like DNA helicase [Eubacterium sp.]|nr:ATP-dependent RecD-like DNA helicase [Eubacterium sp.]